MRAGTAVDSEGPVTARVCKIARSKTGTKRPGPGSRAPAGRYGESEEGGGQDVP